MMLVLVMMMMEVDLSNLNYTDKIRRRFDNSISFPRDCHKSHPLRFYERLFHTDFHSLA
jgi:hypothetical protein